MKAADNEGFVLTVEKKEKREGQKRPVTVETDIAFKYDEIKYTKYLLQF